jgi:DNA-binding transcriptional LysR family regulator
MGIVSEDFTIDLRRLRVLRELERHGTVAATAVALHLTPSAISQQIAGLAKEVGAPLLERNGRGVRLTGQARILLEHAEVVHAQLERARADLAAWTEGQVGFVTIGAFATVISGIVAPALRRLQTTRPGIRPTVVEAEPPEVFTRLDAGEVDVAVAVDYRYSPPRADRRYCRADLLADPLDVVLPVDHPAAAGPSVRLADLAGEEWIVGNPGGCCAEIALAACAGAGFSPDVRHRSNDWDAIAALVAAGAGVAVVPRLAQPLRPAGLAVIPVTGPPPARHIFAAVRAGAEHSPDVAAVLAELRTAAAARLSGLTGVRAGHPAA